MPGMPNRVEEVMPEATEANTIATLCNMTAIRKASRRLTQYYDGVLEPSGLRSTQLMILVALTKRLPPTVGELAEELVLDRSALGHNLRPLIRNGFIALKPSTRDRRRSIVVLTNLGKAKCREAMKLWQSAQDRFESVFGKAKAATLRKTLLGIAHSDRLSGDD